MALGIQHFPLTHINSDYFKVHIPLFVFFIINCLFNIGLLPVGVKPGDIENNKRYPRIEVSIVLINMSNEQAYRDD